MAVSCCSCRSILSACLRPLFPQTTVELVTSPGVTGWVPLSYSQSPFAMWQPKSDLRDPGVSPQVQTCAQKPRVLMEFHEAYPRDLACSVLQVAVSSPFCVWLHHHCNHRRVRRSPVTLDLLHSLLCHTDLVRDPRDVLRLRSSAAVPWLLQRPGRDQAGRRRCTHGHHVSVQVKPATRPTAAPRVHTSAKTPRVATCCCGDNSAPATSTVEAVMIRPTALLDLLSCLHPHRLVCGNRRCHVTTAKIQPPPLPWVFSGRE